jgi:hypothetical protein
MLRKFVCMGFLKAIINRRRVYLVARAIGAGVILGTLTFHEPWGRAHCFSIQASNPPSFNSRLSFR